MRSPKLFLIPNTLGPQEDPRITMGNAVHDELKQLRHFAVENIKDSRRYLVRWGLKELIDQSEFIIHNKKTETESLIELRRIFEKGESLGMISDAGCPGIADPGNQVVILAHQMKIPVVPLVGPSSIFLALMASGMNGQDFAFKGYLPRDSEIRKAVIKELEKRSKQEGSCQIFMETPYRNDGILKDLISVLHPRSRLCTATDLATEKEEIHSLLIDEWRSNQKLAELNKRPTIFLIQA